MKATNTFACQDLILTFNGLKEEFKQGVKDFWWAWLAPQRIINEYNNTFKWPEGGPSIPRTIWLTKPLKLGYTQWESYECGELCQNTQLTHIECEIALFQIKQVSKTRFVLIPIPYKRKAVCAAPVHFAGHAPETILKWKEAPIKWDTKSWEGYRSNNSGSWLNTIVNHSLYGTDLDTNFSWVGVSELIKNLYKGTGLLGVSEHPLEF